MFDYNRAETSTRYNVGAKNNSFYHDYFLYFSGIRLSLQCSPNGHAVDYHLHPVLLRSRGGGGRRYGPAVGKGHLSLLYRAAAAAGSAGRGEKGRFGCEGSPHACTGLAACKNHRTKPRARLRKCERPHRPGKTGVDLTPLRRKKKRLFVLVNGQFRFQLISSYS